MTATGRLDPTLTHPESPAARSEPGWRALPDLLTDRALVSGEDVAVRFGALDLTFRDWEVLANQLAWFLRARGVRRGDRVALFLDRSLWLPVTMLAAHKAGAAYVPLNRADPASRVAQILDDARPALVLTQADLVSELPDGVAYLDLDASNHEIRAMPGTPPAVTVRSDDFAYVIFTSGSTGRPKGVAVPHGAFVNLLASLITRPGITRRDVLLAVTAPSFDPAGLELCHPVVTGGTTVIADQASTMDGRRLRALLASTGSTLLHGTPTTWRILDGAPEVAGLTALVGGEALTPDVAGPLTRTARAVWNLYGPTETTVYSTIRRIKEPDVNEASGALPIGTPIDRTTCHVLDEQLRPVPVGVPGELHIAGEGLAHGYFGRPGLTAERFVANPFGPPGSRLYRTGDRVRAKPDGDLDFLGRNDDQVKVRGFRIETNEIAVHLAAHESVDQAFVSVNEFSPGDRRLVAYVKTSGVSERSLRDHMAARLPAYMLPAVYVTLPELPVTTHGKIDRAALPVPGTARTAADTSQERPFPASAGQERAWHLGSAEAHRTVRLGLTGRLDVNALEFALSAVVARHPALRTRLSHDGRELRQIVFPARRVLLGEKPMATDGPLRVELDARGDDEHLLTVSIQHTAADDRSWDMFRHDLAAFYEGAVARRPPDLPGLAMPAGRYAMVHRARITDDGIRYWRDQLEGMPAVAPSTGETGRLEIDLPDAVRRGTAVQLAAFHLALADITGRADVVVGVKVTVREDDPAPQPFGDFDNTVAVRVDVERVAVFADLLAQVSEQLATGVEYRDIPLTLPLPTLVLRPEPQEQWRLSGLRVDTVSEHCSATPQDLTVTVVGPGAGVLTYPTERYQKSWVRAFAARYVQFLAAAAAAGPSRTRDGIVAR